MSIGKRRAPPFHGHLTIFPPKSESASKYPFSFFCKSDSGDKNQFAEVLILLAAATVCGWQQDLRRRRQFANHCSSHKHKHTNKKSVGCDKFHFQSVCARCPVSSRHKYSYHRLQMLLAAAAGQVMLLKFISRSAFKSLRD